MKRIFLIGYMGAGKTTVGKILAERMGLNFIDLDYYIERRFHKSVRQIFQEKGEAEFRRIEQSLLREVSLFENVLISTGGGSPCFEDNMAFMKEQGITVYLKVSVEELANRLEIAKSSRPMLQGKSGEELKRFIAGSLEVRAPFYEQASIVFDAEIMLTETDIHTIVDNLVLVLKKDS